MEHHRGRSVLGWHCRYVAAPATVELAVEFARRRREAFNPESAVLVHGDAHPANILEDPTAGDGLFKLVDPDGVIADRAYDRAAIWEWAFVERVSTGLFIMQVGTPSMGGHQYLEVADLLTDVDG